MEKLNHINIYETMYFPPVKVIGDWVNHGCLILEKYENYNKRSFRNRCILYAPNGPLSLTIPLIGGRNQKTSIQDIKISFDTNWQELHLRAIKSCYGSAPFFIFYFDEVEKLIRNAGIYLWDFNLSIFEWLATKLKIDSTIFNTSSFLTINPNNSIIDCRDTILPSNYIQLPAKYYNQVFEFKLGFLPNLSVLDILMCLGPQMHLFLIKP